tara:strand:+ start:245 stop:409 length:165 start_codon:yes stop_codon:yes gene_type:complete
MKSAESLPWGFSSNFRAGRIGDWQDDMNTHQIQRCRELLGDILIDLGYEKDLNW